MLFFVASILFALIILFIFNSMTNAFCLRREIPEEHQSKIFRWINVLLTILLVSSYIEIVFT